MCDARADGAWQALDVFFKCLPHNWSRTLFEHLDTRRSVVEDKYMRHMRHVALLLKIIGWEGTEILA